MLVHKYFLCVIIVVFSTFVGESDAQSQEKNSPINFKEVDQCICEILKKPAGGVMEERKLMKGVQLCYQYLDNICDRIDRGWREKENVRQLMAAVGKEGPQMVHSSVDAEAFKKAYEWDDDDVDTLTTTILGIKHMWDQVSKKCITYLEDKKEE